MIDVDSADKGSVDYITVFRCIIVDARSSLDSLRLAALVFTQSAWRGVSANVIAMRHHHGHIFIPAQRFGEAVSALQKLGA